MKTIFLVGFMGSGKSTVGKRLSKELMKTQIDTDDFIEERYSQQISDIFNIYGEETFRAYETNSLKELLTYDIVATGGGIVEKNENIEIMKKNGVIIYLDTSFNEILHRLKNDKTRPLWNNDQKEKMSLLYKRRVEMYKKCADYQIKTYEKDLEDIIEEIGMIIKSMNME